MVTQLVSVGMDLDCLHGTGHWLTEPTPCCGTQWVCQCVCPLDEDDAYSLEMAAYRNSPEYAALVAEWEAEQQAAYDADRDRRDDLNQQAEAEARREGPCWACADGLPQPHYHDLNPEPKELWNSRGGDSAYANYQAMCCGDAATGHQNGQC